jgi:hypothetical protein
MYSIVTSYPLRQPVELHKIVLYRLPPPYILPGHATPQPEQVQFSAARCVERVRLVILHNGRIVPFVADWHHSPRGEPAYSLKYRFTDFLIGISVLSSWGEGG